VSQRGALTLSLVSAFILFSIGMFVLFPLHVDVGDCTAASTQHKCEEQNLLYYLLLKFFEIITHPELWTAFATIAIAAYTRTLYIATRGMKEATDKLWLVTNNTLSHAEVTSIRELRAYIGVEPRTMRRLTSYWSGSRCS
jgi:hypothetical protein